MDNEIHVALSETWNKKEEKQLYQKKIKVDHTKVALAAQHGKLSFLQWALNEGYENCFSTWTLHHAKNHYLGKPEKQNKIIDFVEKTLWHQVATTLVLNSQTNSLPTNETELNPPKKHYIRNGPVTTRDFVELIYHMEKLLGPTYRIDLSSGRMGGLIFRSYPTDDFGIVKIIRTNFSLDTSVYGGSEVPQQKNTLQSLFPEVSQVHFSTLYLWKNDLLNEFASGIETIDELSSTPTYGKVIFFDKEEPWAITSLTISFETCLSKELRNRNETREVQNIWNKSELDATKKALKILGFVKNNQKNIRCLKEQTEVITWLRSGGKKSNT